MMITPREKVYKVRSVKSYPEARNHLLIGWVVAETANYLQMEGRSLHFGRNINTLNDIHMGLVGERIIPWSRIEVINVLDPVFQIDRAELVACEEGIYLEDGSYRVAIIQRLGQSY